MSPARLERRSNGVFLAFCLAWSLLGPTRASAQHADEVSLSREDRRLLQRELAEEVRALELQGNVLKKVVRLIKPTVVHIESTYSDERGQTSARRPVEESGSGIIIELNQRPFVLTNRHVIKHATLERIQIKLWDGRLIRPSRSWADRATDVAVLAVDTHDLTPAMIGDSQQVEIGDFVVAVGSPFGLSHSVTYGIISATGRRDLQLGDDGVRYQDFLQTDAAINPGNSGGPLVNLRGEIIGINTAIASSSGGSEGIGFAIPVNMAMTVARQLIDKGAVSRAYLGVHLDSKFGPTDAIKLGLNRPQGALVSGITPNSPASRADFRMGDVILQFDDIRIEDDSHLQYLVSLTPVGKQVLVQVLRRGQPVQVRVVVEDRDKFEPLP